MLDLEFSSLPNKPDERGDSYYVPRDVIDFLGVIDEIHFTTINHGKTRGNHYHVKRSEVILLFFTDSWRLAWIPSDSREAITHDFSGEGAILVKVNPGIPHAFKNTGTSMLRVVSYSNGRFDPENPDTFHRVLLPN